MRSFRILFGWFDEKPSNQKLKPRYKVGDTVYYLSDDKMNSDVVESYVVCGDKISYQLRYDYRDRSFHSDRLFPSKEALVKHLLK